MSAPDPPVTADLVLDGGDQRCVTLLITLRSAIRSLPDGAVVHLIATDPAAPIDLPAWCHLTGHTYLGPVPDTTRGPTSSLRVRADARGTDPARPWRTA